MCTRENFTLGCAHYGVLRGMLISRSHKGSVGRMCFLRAERRRKIAQIAFVMVKVSALLLLITFVANPLLDQFYSFFSVSEHPMQAACHTHTHTHTGPNFRTVDPAGSTVRKFGPGSTVRKFGPVCVCVWGGGGAPPVSATVSPFPTK